MAVSLVFLRPRGDGTWEGFSELRGWGEFGDLLDVYLDRGGPTFPYFRDDEYDMDVEGKEPPYPVRVSEKLACELVEWIETERPKALAVLHELTDEEIPPHTDTIKYLIEKYLEEEYAILISP